MNDKHPKMKRQSGLLSAAFFGNCPQCNERTLFDGAMFAGGANFASKCNNCGLDYDGFNVGDGPAAFLTFMMGALIVTLALSLELSAHPPFWVHIILWVPLTAILTIVSLRIAKGVLLTLEYRNKAKEAGADDVADLGDDNDT